MENCKMVYPMHTCAFPIGVPERPEKISQALGGPGNERQVVHVWYSTEMVSDKLPVCGAQ